MTDFGAIEVLIQGGAVGLALGLVWVNYKLVSNHMNHNTDAISKMTEAITELTTYIRTINEK